MTNKFTMIELFSGIGAQERALRQICNDYEIIHTCDCDKDVVLSYAAMRYNIEEEINNFNFPSQEQMIEELQAKNVGYDFQKGKHSITSRTSIKKLKQYYIADRLSKNLGDISKVEKLPYSDMVTYSFPCTDLSVAGKGEGMTLKCDNCGYNWPIDFNNVSDNDSCPNCGNEVTSSTRSGLLGQVQRLLSVSELPKYLLLENVKNLVGKKFIGQFNSWIRWLDSIGYNTYYEVLNAKHYGIPQNRERIFAISVRKDIDDGTFTFPTKISLTTRLKDVLEKNVAENYYISNERVEQILNSDFLKEKIRNRNNKEEVPVRLTNIYGEQFGTGYAGNVWDQNGLSPTLQTAQGGNRQPLIVEEEPFIVASRGRNPDNPSDRTTGAPTEQRLEPNMSGTTNTITTVQKDNYVCEPVIYDDYNSRFSADQDVINTLTTNCGASAIRNGVKIIEPIVCEERRDEGIRFFKDECVGTLRTIDACGDKRVIEPNIIRVGQVSSDGSQSGMVYDTNGVFPTVCACTHGYAIGNILEESDITTIKVKNQATEFAGYTDVAGTLMARDYKGFGNQEMTAIVEKIYEPEIIKEDIVFPVTVRKYQVDIKRLKTILRENKCYSNKEIAEKLNKPVTLVEHWFRQDECFAIPDADVWPELKNLLGITTDDFDESIMTFEEKDGVYDKTNRCYHINGIAPTLTVASANEKIIEINDSCIKWRIRKLTPTECWRLMGFTDEDCNRAAEYVSASALYKQAGNSIYTGCLVAIMYSLFNNDSSDAYSQHLIDFKL